MATLNLSPSADDTLYQDATGHLSNGAGPTFYVGDTAQNTSQRIRRGIIKFDLSSIPAGSTITSATLTLHVSKVAGGGASQATVLHRALKNWNEGTSNASQGGQGGGGGDGVQASTGEVTWLYTTYNSQSWSAAGGDFVSAGSASTNVGGVATYQWSGSGVLADIQGWLSSPATNFGWIITGNETSSATAKQFDSKESGSTSNRPVLSITYTPPTPDLTITKTHTDPFRPGDAADTYTITVTNNGPGATSGTVTVTDTVPTGLTPTSANSGLKNGWIYFTSGQTVTASRGTVLASGASYPPLVVTVSVNNDAPSSVTNTATVSGGGDVSPGNNTATDPTNIVAPSDLTISKSHTGNLRQGDAADVYTLTVNNVGTGATAGTVTVTDTLPDGLTPAAANTGVINGWSISTNGQVVTATRSDALASGGSYPALPITVSVAGNAPASLTNSATVSGGGDVNPNNNSAADPTTITQVADLTLSKSHTGSFRQGDSSDSFTFTVRNVGPGPTTGAVTITDILPAGFSPTAADSGVIGGWTVSTSGQTITATRSDALAAGNSYPALSLTVAVAPTASANLTNTATVSGGGEIVTTNDSASDQVNITQLPDLTIAKGHTDAFHPDDPADHYTITVTNVGAVSTDGSTITVIDTLPAGLAPTSADFGPQNGWTIQFTGQTITATRSDVLASGASYPPLVVTVSVAHGVGRTVINSAAVSGGGEVNTTNDTASDPTATIRVPDLTISKSHTDAFRQGDAADHYAITVSNIGSDSTTGAVTVTDVLPAGLTPTTANSGTMLGWTVTTNGQTVTATRSDTLAAGQSYPALTLTVKVANDAPASITNTATVSGGGEVKTTNDSSSDLTSITQAADLVLSKSHAGNFRQGDAADTYTLTVRNAGPGPTVGAVTVTDTLPAGLTPTATNGSVITGWSISVSGQTVTATRSDALASSASYPALTLGVRVATNASASVTNTASVSGGGELNTANDSVGDPSTIAQVADLTVSMSHSGVFHTGDAGDTFAVTVKNTGPGPTAGAVTVKYVVPAGFAPTAADSGVINGWTVSFVGQTITATRSDALASGASYPVLTLTVKVGGTMSAGTLTNAVSVSGGGELNTNNNSFSDIVTLLAGEQIRRRRGA